MVMETPSPQCVAVEFVRQYYTVLNKEPLLLHRFYSHNSSFMHGGPNSMTDPIIGQLDIYKKIMSLNFCDCHAKIRLVDAHATLSNGVVVQVSGELSNNGMPMRRFMQTFVLAPQTPKKYYVHNDIFRYQDEVFGDNLSEEEGVPDAEEHLENRALETSSPAPAINGTTHHSEVESAAPFVPISENENYTPAEKIVSSSPSIGVTAQTPPSPSAPALPAADAPLPSPPPGESDTAGWTTKTDNWGDGPNYESWNDEPCNSQDEKSPDPEAPNEEVSNAEVASMSSSAANERKDYASLFKGQASSYNSKHGHQSAAPVCPQNAQMSPPQPEPPTNIESPETQEPVSRMSGSGGTESSRNNVGSFQRNVRNSNNRQISRDRPSYRNNSDEFGHSEGGGNYQEERRPNLPDSHQVFVGNLSHEITEENLYELFAAFGKIVDVRINTSKNKLNAKGTSHSVPNFGFVTFDDENAVEKCLNSRPIHWNGERRLNVEEKKARNRMDGMPNLGMNRGPPNRGGMRQGQPGRGGQDGRGMGGGRGFRAAGDGGSRGGSRGSYIPRR